jgi:hypothetical protein
MCCGLCPFLCCCPQRVRRCVELSARAVLAAGVVAAVVVWFVYL